MAERVVLHIGAMKSGTSFIQGVLGTNGELLARQGFRFAGERYVDQVRGVMELIDHGGTLQRRMPKDGDWARLVGDINAHKGTAIVSVEFLGPRSRAKIKQLLDSFPEATRFEAVMTVRDFARVVPAMWQESVQNGGVTPWPSFLAQVKEPPSEEGPGAWFWRQQNTPEIAERWAKVVGRDAFTLITVPPPGTDRSLLWQRFAEVVGLDPGGFNLKVRKNASLGLASTLVLRELNERLDSESMDRKVYHRFIKHSLAKRGMVRHKDEPALGLDEPWVFERGRQLVEELRALGLRVVGSLDELEPHPVEGIQPHEVDLRAQYDAALHALTVAVRKWSGAEPPRKRKRRLLGRDGG